MNDSSSSPRGRPFALDPAYTVAALLVLVIEVAIALWIDDRFIRPHAGDSLAVVLVYLALRAATPLRVVPAVGVALAVAFAVELAQLYHFVDAVGLGAYPVARVVLGTGFDPRDFAAYAAGGALVLLGERARRCHT